MRIFTARLFAMRILAMRIFAMRIFTARLFAMRIFAMRIFAMRIFTARTISTKSFLLQISRILNFVCNARKRDLSSVLKRRSEASSNCELPNQQNGLRRLRTNVGAPKPRSWKSKTWTGRSQKELPSAANTIVILFTRWGPSFPCLISMMTVGTNARAEFTFSCLGRKL